MAKAATQTRHNRTITVDFHDETTYAHLLDNGKAFLEWVLAFILSIGFQLAHQGTCKGGGCLTRHSHYIRIRLGGITIWRIQCTRCKSVFTVLPHFVLRYRQMRPEVARNAFILFGTGGEIATNRQEDQEVMMLALHLLQNCLVFINTLMIQRVLREAAWEQRLTVALMYSHISPYGAFLLDMHSRLDLERPMEAAHARHEHGAAQLGSKAVQPTWSVR